MERIHGKPQAQANGDPNGAGEQNQTPARETGTGALCPEAQADGVPCSEIGRDCEICEKAQQED